MKNLNVKSKLIGGFSIILAMLVIVSTVSISALRKADEELTNYAAGTGIAKQEVARLGLALNSGARAVRNMYIYALDDPGTISTYESNFKAQVTAAEGHLDKIADTGVVDASLLASYETAMQSWLVNEEAVINYLKAGDFVNAMDTLENKCAPGLDNAASIRSNIATQLDQLDVDVLAASAKSNMTSTYISIALAVAAVAFGAIVMIVLLKDILTPISAISKSMGALSEGDLSYVNDFRSNDEFGKLCDTVRSTTTDLESYINEINRAMKELSNGNFDIKSEVEFRGDFRNIQTSILDMVAVISDTLAQIGTVSEQVSIGSNQVAVGAQTLAQGSTEQASTVEELSDSIDSVTKEIQANSENANLASKIATDMGREIEISNQQMQSTVNAMQDINTKSNEISKIVKIIDDIAFQTNILALNAAVEAARAGVAGKGFAVVADEVRNLASKSGEAARNITVLIGDSMQSVNQGNDVATKAAETLESVVKNAEEVIIKIDDIASASRTQSEATEKINEGINQISSVVQSISATAEESAAASEELASQSTTLNNLLANFTLGKGAGKASGKRSKKSAPKAKAQPQFDDFDDFSDDYDDYNDKY